MVGTLARAAVWSSVGAVAVPRPYDSAVHTSALCSGQTSFTSQGCLPGSGE